MPRAAGKPKYGESTSQFYTRPLYPRGICGNVHAYISIIYIYIHVLCIDYTDPHAPCTLLWGLLYISVYITVTSTHTRTQRQLEHGCRTGDVSMVCAAIQSGVDINIELSEVKTCKFKHLVVLTVLPVHVHEMEVAAYHNYIYNCTSSNRCSNLHSKYLLNQSNVVIDKCTRSQEMSTSLRVHL